ncbi:MAG: DUF4176 domain-containing protein [Bacilli bacterium]|nr:DUF4176 domain-containing protein [Bacilli bacterium]
MNGQIREKYLPVGSVVLLQNGSKRVMINGFCTMDASKPDKIYDYSGVLFPEGSLSSDQTLLFDHSQIIRIDHIGLDDQEEREFKVKLAQIVAAANQSGSIPGGQSPQTMPNQMQNPGMMNGQAPTYPQNPMNPQNPNNY